MKSLQELSEMGTTQSILGMKVAFRNIAIGRVIKLLTTRTNLQELKFRRIPIPQLLTGADNSVHFCMDLTS